MSDVNWTMLVPLHPKPCVIKIHTLLDLTPILLLLTHTTPIYILVGHGEMSTEAIVCVCVCVINTLTKHDS